VPRRRKRQPAPTPVQGTVPRAGTQCPARTFHAQAFQEAERRGEEFLPWRLIPIHLPPRDPTAHRYFRPVTKDIGTQTIHQGTDQGTQTPTEPLPEFWPPGFPPEDLPPPVSPLPDSPPKTPPKKPRTPFKKPRTPGRRRIRPVSASLIKAIKNNRPS